MFLNVLINLTNYTIINSCPMVSIDKNIFDLMNWPLNLLKMVLFDKLKVLLVFLSDNLQVKCRLPN